MSYDTNNLKNNRGGATLETSDKPATPAGLYRHPETGAEIITLFDPLFGDVQSEGITRLGFERVGDAPEGSIKSVVEVILDEKTKDSSVTGLAARLEKLENVAEDKKALEQKNAELEKELARYRAKDGQTVESGEEAKAEAESQVEARGADNSGHVADNGGVNSTETPVAPADETPSVEDTAEDGRVDGEDESQSTDNQGEGDTSTDGESDEAGDETAGEGTADQTSENQNTNGTEGK